MWTTLRLSLFVLLAARSLAADIVPAVNRVPWVGGVDVGIVGGIPARATISTTITPSTGDRSGAINSAISAASANTTVKLAAGTFDLSNTVNLNRNNVTLRGTVDANGVPTTILNCTGILMRHIFIGWDSDWPFPRDGSTITAGLAKGSTVITIADTSSFTVGNLVRVSEDDDLSIPVFTINGPTFTLDRARFQTAKIVSKTSTTLTLSNGLYWTYSAARNPKVHHVVLISTGVGLEDVIINCASSGTANTIDVWNSYGFHIKNVRINQAKNYGIFLFGTAGGEIRHCYINQLQNAGNNGSGILVQMSSACWFEDNIVYQTQPFFEVNFGCTGNAFTFNFLENVDVFAQVMGPGLDTNHGPHNSFNLYEGNVASNIVADGTFGSVSHDTLLRNRAHATNESGTGTSTYGRSRAIDLRRMTRNYNVVGNVLGVPQSFWNATTAGRPVVITGVYQDNTSFNHFATGVIWNLGRPNMGGEGIGSGTASFSTGDPWVDYPTRGDQNTLYQEFDLDVEATLLRKGNWNGVNQAVPAGESLGADTVATSYVYAAKPTFFASLAWPAFDPPTYTFTTLNADFQRIPAGYRYLNGVDPTSGADVTPPTIVSGNIPAAGTSIVLTASEDVVAGAGGTGGFTISASGGAITSSSKVVAGTTVTLATLSRTFGAGETVTVSYVQPGNGIEDAAGNDLATFSGQSITNSVNDVTAPTPNPMTFATVPFALSSTVIQMVATTATDSVSPPVRYDFDETSGNAGGADSGQQLSATYTMSGLSAGTLYTVRVRAFDSATSQNATTFSTGSNVTTMALPSAPTGPSATAISQTQINLAWVDVATDETGYLVERSLVSGSGFVLIDTLPAGSTSYSDTVLTANTAYFYRVRAYRDAIQAGPPTDFSAYTSQVTATTSASGSAARVRRPHFRPIPRL